MANLKEKNKKTEQAPAEDKEMQSDKQTLQLEGDAEKEDDIAALQKMADDSKEVEEIEKVEEQANKEEEEAKKEEEEAKKEEEEAKKEDSDKEVKEESNKSKEEKKKSDK